MTSKLLHLMLLLASAAYQVTAYNTDICCNLAKANQSFKANPNDPQYDKNNISSPPPLANQTCGQTYSDDTPAALPLYVDYAFCSSKCGGMGRSQWDQPSEWAAPVVQFLLPSVIFSLSIPRERVIDVDFTETISKWGVENSFYQMLIFLAGFIIVLFPVLVDSVLWIILIVVGAGNMLIGGLYEAVIDVSIVRCWGRILLMTTQYRILKFVKTLDSSKLAVELDSRAPSLTTNEKKDLLAAQLEMKQELLATLASGNLRLEPKSPDDPKTKILDSLKSPEINADRSRSRLLNLIGAQSAFGGAIGAPVLFYLGAFIYTILDLKNDPSDQDNAISLGFGIEWMIVVHVAIVSGTLLAANNPSTSSGITGSRHKAMGPRKPKDWKARLGWSNTYDTDFQPVSIWDRGENKMKWIENTLAWEDDELKDRFRAEMNFSWRAWFLIFLMAFFLIVIPPAAGGVVAFFTPPKGVACRSLSFVVYGTSQVRPIYIPSFLLRRCKHKG